MRTLKIRCRRIAFFVLPLLLACGSESPIHLGMRSRTLL